MEEEKLEEEIDFEAIKGDETNLQGLETPKRKRDADSSDDEKTKEKKQKCWSYQHLTGKMGKRKDKIMRDRSMSEEGDLVYIILQDITNNIKNPFILDLKVGTQQHSPDEPEKKIQSKTQKCLNSTSSTLGLRLCGMRTFLDGKEETKDKYDGRALSEDGFKESIHQFVAFTKEEKENNVRVDVVEALISQINELVETIKGTRWRFYGCSVLITFDGKKQEKGKTVCKPLLKVIDFAKADFTGDNVGYDKGFVFGLVTLKEILLSTIE